MIAACGRPDGGGVERLLAARGGDDLESGLAQHHAERPQDLQLVVADEHARAALGHAAALPAGVGTRDALERELEHEARALTGQRLDPDLAAVGLDEPARDREPEAGPAMAGRARCRCGRTARRRARAAPAGCPARGRRRASMMRLCSGHARTSTGSPSGVAHGVLEQVRERPLELGGVRADQRQLRRRSAAGMRPRTPDVSTAATITSPRSHQSTRGSAASASSRDRSSRLSISRDSRCASSRDRRRQLAALVVARGRSPPSGSTAVRIAVSGERRSCDTARSSAVLTTSLRRSAAASTRLPSSSSRSIAAASSASSDGHDALLDAAQRRLREVRRHEQRAELARALAQRERQPALVALDGAAARSPPTAGRASATGGGRHRRVRGRGRPMSAAAGAPSRRPGRPRADADPPPQPAVARVAPARWRRSP